MLGDGVIANGIPRRRGRVLRVRPGHLANFSGASGYMPFIVLFSVPASFVAFLVSSLVASLQVRALARGSGGDGPAETPDAAPREDLTAYVGLVRTHLLWCLGVTVLLGLLFTVWAIDLIYTPSPDLIVVAIVLAVGPLVSWLVSVRFLFRLLRTRGPHVGLVVLSLLVYVLGIALCLVLSALLGVPVWVP
jgi:hypothetical protein